MRPRGRTSARSARSCLPCGHHGAEKNSPSGGSPRFTVSRAHRRILPELVRCAMSTRKILKLSLPPEMLWVYAIPSAPIDHGLLQHVPELRVFLAHLARGNMPSSRFPPRSVGDLLPQPPVRHSVMFDTNSLPCLPRILPSASLLRAAFPLLWITPPLRRQKK